MNVRILLLGAAILCLQNASLMAMDEAENDLDALSRSLNATLKATDQASVISTYYLVRGLSVQLYQEKQGVVLQDEREELSELEILEQERMKKLRAPYDQQMLRMVLSNMK